MENAKNKQGIMKKVGDKIERLGETVSKTGAEKIGNAIYRAGDGIEHSQDKKDQTAIKKNQK